MSSTWFTYAQRMGLALPLLLTLCFGAQAQEVEVTRGLICDTRQQVEEFVALYDGDAGSTVEKVNAAENNPTACVISAMAYVRGPELAKARTKDTTFQIVPVLVVGIVTDRGVQAVAPARFFSVIEVKEIAV
jgi:hypothetical protein